MFKSVFANVGYRISIAITLEQHQKAESPIDLINDGISIAVTLEQ